MPPKASPGWSVDGRRVLVLIPDGTRTMPMPAMFEILERELGPRVAALDYLVALGTHSPMDDAQLSALVGRPVVGGRAGAPSDLQPSLGRSGDIRGARHHSGECRGGSHGRSIEPYRARGTEPPRHRVRPRPDLRSRVPSRSRRLFRRDQVPVPGDCSAGDHPLHALARSADHEFGSDWHDRHAGARGHQHRRCDVEDAALTARAGRHPRRHGGTVLRRSA